MRAMILAAGLGTRLKPLTEETPKALMPVVNTPALARNIAYLSSYGIREIIVNCHYLGQKIIDFVKTMISSELKLEVKEEPEILGTGGGIFNCRDFLGKGPFLVVNSDIITNISLDKVLESYKKSGAMVTMVLHNRKPFNQIQLNSAGNIVKINNENHENLLAFTGIHVLEPGIFDYIPNSGYSDIIDVYRSLIAAKIDINSFVAKGHIWHDIGTIESYRNANRELLELKGEKISIGNNTIIDPSAVFKNWGVIGNSSVIKKNVFINESVIWNNVIIEEGVSISNSIVTSGARVTKDLQNEIFQR